MFIFYKKKLSNINFNDYNVEKKKRLKRYEFQKKENKIIERLSKVQF